MRTRVAVLFASLLLAAAVVTRADRYEYVPPRATFAGFPMQVAEFRGVQQPPMDEKILAILGVDDYLTRAYFTPQGAGVGVYVGYWQSQRQGDTIHSPQNCLPGAGWEPVAQGLLTMADPRGPSNPQVVVNRYIIQKGLDKQLVLYWYQSHGRVVASEYWSKIYLVTDAIRLNRSDGALVRVIVPDRQQRR